MKNIEFFDKNAIVLYNKYLSAVKRIIKTLPKEDQDDILMEINSHIYESMQCDSYIAEIDRIKNTLEKLGSPQESFAPLVADRKLLQATKTFNPLHVIKALSLNISNGFVYVLFSVLYLLLLGFVFLIFVKIAYPHNTGLFIGENEIHFGFISNIINDSLTDVLGVWFIPVVVLAMVITYVFITGLLKLKYILKRNK